jgi:hypothetical protein
MKLKYLILSSTLIKYDFQKQNVCMVKWPEGHQNTDVESKMHLLYKYGPLGILKNWTIEIKITQIE